MALGDYIRRIILGPTDDEISAKSLEAGGPPYPITPTSTAVPTNLRGTDELAAWGISSQDLPDPAVTRRVVTGEDPPGEPGRPDDSLTAAEFGELTEDIPAYPKPYAPKRPMVGRPYPIPRLDTLEDPVPEPHATADADPGYDGNPAPGDAPLTPGRYGHVSRLDPAAHPRTLADLQPEESGVHHLPDSDDRAVRVPCTECEGTGYVTRPVNDLLRESVALLGDNGDDVVREFYRRLLTNAPHLGPLFPPDLVAEDAIHGQRDRLLKAIVALSDLYDPRDSDKMTRLDTALRAFGRSHAAFARPDGTVRGATLDEYAAVKQVLFGTLVDVAGQAWKGAYTQAWDEAYDYAAVVMLDEQRVTAMSFPRYPRQAADETAADRG